MSMMYRVSCTVSLTGQNDTVLRQEIAVGPTAGNGLNMTVYLEANSTTSAVLGLVVFSDVDQNDVIDYSSVTLVEAGSSLGGQCVCVCARTRYVILH